MDSQSHPSPKEWNERRFYIRFLWLPIIAGVTAAIFVFGSDPLVKTFFPLPTDASLWSMNSDEYDAYEASFAKQLRDTLFYIKQFLFLFMMSAVIGGVPYALLVLFGLWRLRKKSLKALKVWGATLPLQLAGLFLLFPLYAVITEFDKLPTNWNGWRETMIYPVFCLVFGYFYVALAFTIGYFKKRYHTKKGTHQLNV